MGFSSGWGRYFLVVLKARILTQYAQKHGKLSAITETGTQTRDSLWYTQLLSILRSEGVALNYVCTWSGFSPYKGHPAAADFVGLRGTLWCSSLMKFLILYLALNLLINNIMEC